MDGIITSPNNKMNAGKALRESEERQRFLLDMMDQAMVIMEKIESLPGEPGDYRYVFTNPAFESQMGLHNVVGKRVREVIPGLKQDIIGMYDGVLRAMRRVKSEAHIAALGKWFQIEAFPMPAPGHLAIVYTDITERKRAGEALLRTSEELRKKEEETLELIDGFTEGSWIVDCREGTIKCSDKWARRIGLDQVPEEERLAYTHMLPHPDDTANGNSINDCMNAGLARFDLEYRIKTMDKGYIWTQNRGKIVYDEQGKAIKVYAATIDITGRKRTQEALRDSEQRLRLATQAAGMYTWELDIATGEIRFSGNVKSIVGFTYTEHDDNFSRIDRYTVPEDGARHKEALLSTMRGEGDLHSVNRVVNPETGEIVWLETYATLIRDSDGTPRRIVGIAQNITESKRAEDALRQSEEREAYLLRLSDALRPLSSVVEIQRAAMRVAGEHLGVDRAMYNEIINDGTVIHIEDNYVSDGFPKATGDFPVSSFGAAMDVLRRGELLIIEDQTCTPLKKPMERSASTSIRVFASATVPLIKDGQWVANFGVTHGNPRKWKDNEIILLQETAERTWDAVERARAETALRESTHKLEEANRQKEIILESISDCFYALDSDLRFTYVNKAAEEIWNLSRADLIGRRIEDVFSGLIDISLSKFHHVLEEQAPLHYEVYSLVAKRWGDMSVYPARDGICVYFHDTTERKRAEEALRENEEKYHALFDSIDDGYCIIEVLFDDNAEPIDYRFLEVNQSFERQTGLVDAAGRRMREMAPNHEQHWFDIYGRIALTGEPLRFQNPADALGRFYDVYAFRVGEPEQRRVAILFNDINERKRAEEALRESEAQARVLSEALEKKNCLVTDFFINISHEFKTPLTILMLGLELLETKAKKMKGGDSVAGNLAAMKQNSYRLNRLVANLLDITKLDAGFMQPKWHEADVAMLLQNLAKSVEPYAAQRQLTLKCECAPTRIPFMTDGFMLERIVLNLLSNAIKHTPAGGRIHISCRANGDGISIAVADTGEGIPEDKQAIIFDRFSQVDTKMTRASEGTGIGLALTKSLVELLGGKITVESAPGAGSTFTAELPYVRMKAANSMPEQGAMPIDKRVQMELSDIMIA